MAVSKSSPATFTNRLHYLQLPLTINLNIPLSEKATLTVKAGGYAAVGLLGKACMKIDDTDYKKTYAGNLFSSGCDYNGLAYYDYDYDGSVSHDSNHLIRTDAYHRFDAGLTSGIELRCKCIIVGIETDLGLVSLGKPFRKNDLGGFMSALFFSPGGTTNNLNIGFTVAYILNE